MPQVWPTRRAQQGMRSVSAEKPTRILTGAQLWGNASAIAAHHSWVRGFTNASVIIGVQKSGTTALGALLRLVLGLRGKTHRKELHLFAMPRSLSFFRRHIVELAERSHGGRWLTDATPNYFQSLTALQQYRIVLPHARFWVILRDPVDRWRHSATRPPTARILSPPRPFCRCPGPSRRGTRTGGRRPSSGPSAWRCTRS